MKIKYDKKMLILTLSKGCEDMFKNINLILILF